MVPSPEEAAADWTCHTSPSIEPRRAADFATHGPHRFDVASAGEKQSVESKSQYRERHDQCRSVSSQTFYHHADNREENHICGSAVVIKVTNNASYVTN